MDERIKKEYSRKAGRSQKMLNFRCDLDNIELLATVANKGRAINEAIREYFRNRDTSKEIAGDIDPASTDTEDYLA